MAGRIIKHYFLNKMKRSERGDESRGSRRQWLGILFFIGIAVNEVYAVQLPPVDALAEVSLRPSPGRQLDAAVSQRVVDAHYEPRLDIPTFVRLQRAKRGASSASANASSAEQAARAELKDLASLYRLTPAMIDAAPLHHVQSMPNGAQLVKFTHQYQGIAVFREQATILLDATQQALAVGGFLGNTAPADVPKSTFSLSAVEAVTVALGDYGFAPSVSALLQTEAISSAAARANEANPHRYYSLPGQSVSLTGARMEAPARVKKVWFRLPAGLVAAYYIELQIAGPESSNRGYYSYVIAANDGRLLFRHNLTADASAHSYRIWAESSGNHFPFPGPQGRNGTPHPTGLPDGYQAPFVAQTLLSLANGPISTNDPWLPDNANRTIGNNVEAWANLIGTEPKSPDGDSTFDADPNECDMSATIAGDLHACTTSPNVFDHTYNPTLPPQASKSQIMSAVTNLFYVNNWLHDWYYDAGFNEVAGNAQDNNFGRGGLGSDSIKAQGLDYSDLNNADMSVPSDGARPRMRMFLWSGVSAATASVSTPASMSGIYTVGSASFGPQTFDLTGAVVQALPNDGCSAITNILSGKIALIDRGTCLFVEKVKNAQNAGALGVVIANNTSGVFTMGGEDASITLPVLMVSQADGVKIKAALVANNVVTFRLQSQSGIARDGTIDNTMIAHEWGHYISNRLIGDANGLSTNMSGGLGEGWADFHALLMVAKAEDAQLAANSNFKGVYAVSSYVKGGPSLGNVLNNGFYYGIRRYPYSTDLSKNPLTFQHIQKDIPLPANPAPSFGGDGADNAEVHSTGEIWASMLWECYAGLLRDTGRLSFSQAQDRMKRYLVAGYKLTPVAPTLIEARDALLAAMASQDVQDMQVCAAGFAKRGAGVQAASGDRYDPDNRGVVESFVVGGDLAITHVAYDALGSAYCDADAFLDNGETGVVNVTVENSGTLPLTGITVSLSASVPELAYPNGNSMTLPAVAPFASAVASIKVKLSGAKTPGVAILTASANHPAMAVPGAVTRTLSILTQRDTKLNQRTTDDIEVVPSDWVVSNPSGPTAQNWVIAEVAAGDHRWWAPTGRMPGVTWLTSPPLKVAASGNLTLSFKHQYLFESDSDGNYDGGVIEVSDNAGLNWIDVNALVPGVYGKNIIIEYPDNKNPLQGRTAFVGSSPGYPLMNVQTIDFGSRFSGKTVLIRFGAGTDNAGMGRGWEIDDISLGNLSNLPFSVFVSDAGACSVMTATGGTPQSSMPNTAFATPFTALVQDARGAPVVGAAVTFTAPATGASGQFASGGTSFSAQTDNAGIAIASAFTANATPGAYHVTANSGQRTVNYALANGSLQTIRFLSSPTLAVGGVATLSAVASSGLSVSYRSLSSEVCGMASGSRVFGIVPGTCTIAANQAGNSIFAPALQAIQSFPVSARVERPGAPTLQRLIPGPGRITVIVNPPASNGGSLILEYTATCQESGGTSFGASGSGPSIVVSGLSNGVVYACTVHAINSAGSGAESSAASVSAGKSPSILPAIDLLLE
jgi:large repetitive protein